jgi:hypothetical protein
LLYPFPATLQIETRWAAVYLSYEMKGGAPFNWRKVTFRLWLWALALTLALWIYPVAYRTTRVLFVLGIAAVWGGAIFLWWRRKMVSVSLMAATVIALSLICLPARPVKTEVLARDYCSALQLFRGSRYVWGGEGLLGIDCSGLVRQGMIWGQICYGVRTLNGGCVRDALGLWWNDCSALALRDGGDGLTRECFRADAIAKVDDTRLMPGDLAVTADGVHVLAYLGNRTWMEADPTLNKTVEIKMPTDNPWFQIPVVIMRWKQLELL